MPGCGPPTNKRGNRSASPSFGTLIKCVGSIVKWVGSARNKKCPKSVSWTLLAQSATRVREVGQGVTKSQVLNDLAVNKLLSYLHRNITNPATR